MAGKIAGSSSFCPEMDMTKQDLAGKTILEVGSGRGDTTRKLVEALSGQPGASLIATDVSDAHFPRLREAFRDAPVPVRFLATRAQELAGIDSGSIDYLICNYTLCAVNAQAGQAVLALRRFRQVLRTGGYLLVEEELPIDRAETPEQEVWAEKWRILKAMTLIAGGCPYTEFAPVTLADLCRLVGFEDVAWTLATEVYCGADVLSFFERRLGWLLPEMPNAELRAGFAVWAAALKQKAGRVGGMDVPIYRLTARKS